MDDDGMTLGAAIHALDPNAQAASPRESGSGAARGRETGEPGGIPLARRRLMQRITFFIVTLCVLSSACDSSTSPTAPTLIFNGTSAGASGMTQHQSPTLTSIGTLIPTAPPVLSPVPVPSLMPFPAVSTITVPGASPVPTNPIPFPTMSPVPIPGAITSPTAGGSSPIVAKH